MDLDHDIDREDYDGNDGTWIPSDFFPVDLDDEDYPREDDDGNDR